MSTLWWIGLAMLTPGVLLGLRMAYVQIKNDPGKFVENVLITVSILGALSTVVGLAIVIVETLDNFWPAK